MALQYWRAQGVEGRSRLLTVRGGYHGDTFGAMGVCDPVNGMHTEMFGGARVDGEIDSDAEQERSWVDDWRQRRLPRSPRRAREAPLRPPPRAALRRGVRRGGRGQPALARHFLDTS